MEIKLRDAVCLPRVGTGLPGYGAPVVLVVLFALADAALLAGTGLHVSGVPAKLPLLALLLAGSLFYTRLRPSPALAELAAFMGLWVAFSVAGAVMTYAAAALAGGLALRDAALLRADLALGFDWAAWTGFVRAHAVFGLVLKAGYASFMPQILGSVALFALLRVPGRNREFLLASGIALALVAVGSAAVPSIGPCVEVGMDVPEPGVCAYVAEMLALRGDTRRYELAALYGIVTFPSFHTVVAILLPYAHRGLRSFVPVLALNAVMLVSIPSEGGHYVADMVGGAVIAAMAILALRRYPFRTASASAGSILPS